MVMEVKIPTKKIQELMKKFEGAEQIYDSMARPVMEEVVNRIHRDVVQRMPVGVTSDLRGKTATEIRGRGINLQGKVVSSSLHGEIIEHGVPANRVFPPWRDSALRRWVEIKGITLTGFPEATLSQKTFVIARGIYKKGITAVRMFQTTSKNLNSWIVKKFEDVNRKFINRF